MEGNAVQLSLENQQGVACCCWPWATMVEYTVVVKQAKNILKAKSSWYFL
uniref:Uncharacterized protein n=1 Tax=Anguilla anguilla TaxID=7936 RepID=A0A0E9UAC2_ANGAN